MEVEPAMDLFVDLLIGGWLLNSWVQYLPLPQKPCSVERACRYYMEWAAESFERELCG